MVRTIVFATALLITSLAYAGDATLTPRPAPTGDADADWKYRSTLPGTVRAFHMDEPDILMASSTKAKLKNDQKNSYLGNYGVMAGTAGIATVDRSVKPSGAGSLRFDVAPFAGPNPAGSFFANFSEDLLTQFGENSEFYLQLRTRWDDALHDTVFQEAGGGLQAGIKFFDVTAGDVQGGYKPDPYLGVTHNYSSSEAKIVIQTYYQNRVPIMYAYDANGSNPPFFEQTSNSFFGVQNAMPAPYCRYPTVNGGTIGPQPGCFDPKANQWVTWLLHVKLGPKAIIKGIAWWTESTVKLYAAHEGQKYQLLINFNPSTPGYFDRKISQVPSEYNFKIGKVWLFPYLTNKSSTQAHPVGRAWYSELIISRNWIPEPGLSNRP